MRTLLDLFLNLDHHLTQMVATYGGWVHALLFLVIFAETGLVVTPFLPGDSLLFAAGAIAATGALDIKAVIGLLIVAAVLGDAVDYAIGRYAGRRVFELSAGGGPLSRLIKKDHLDRAHEFFERYGGKAIVLARFVPIVRTFVPFVAGAASMTYSNFAFYNVTGGILWVALCTGAGYAFGNIPVVQENFSLVVLGIVGVSVLPFVVEFWRARQRRTSLQAESSRAD